MRSLKATLLSIGVLTAASATAWAASDNYQLHVRPDPSSKVIESVNKNQPLISIYQQQNGWTKVGDPRNGVTGWIQPIQPQQPDHNKSQTTKTIKTANGTKTITKGVVRTPQGPMEYQIVQFTSNGKNSNNDRDQKLLKSLQGEQVQMNKAFAESWQDFNKMQAQMTKIMREQHKAMEKMFQQFNDQTAPSKNINGASERTV
ncbi:SH3 domain-containing protein [Piscirickettsia litoralis]|nr:SH3 domain-containing protein [Piscirickettsia litoralis]